MPILIFVYVATMTLYVKGFKVDREKVAKIVEARDQMDLGSRLVSLSSWI
jgi:hypothetical protein